MLIQIGGADAVCVCDAFMPMKMGNDDCTETFPSKTKLINQTLDGQKPNFASNMRRAFGSLLYCVCQAIGKYYITNWMNWMDILRILRVPVCTRSIVIFHTAASTAAAAAQILWDIISFISSTPESRKKMCPKQFEWQVDRWNAPELLSHYNS